MSNDQVRACPFCGDKPHNESIGKFHHIRCKNPACEVKPRTSWCYTLEEAAKIWEGHKNTKGDNNA